MQITQSLSQRMEQKLVMTRQMIQSIEMLQLPLMDLQQNINQELVSNPWLEMGELVEAQEGSENDGDRDGDGEGEGDYDRELRAERDGDGAATGEDGRDLFAEERERDHTADPTEPSTHELLDAEHDARIKRMEALLEEWNDPRTRNSGGISYGGGEEDAKLEAMNNTAAPDTSLEQHLLEQLHMLREEEKLKDLAEIVVGSLDDHGFLRVPLMDLFYKNEGGIHLSMVGYEVSEDDAELALALVQGLDPAGVGARDLQECLLLQMRRLAEDTVFEEQLVERHLDDLSHNRLPKIAKDMGVSIDRVKEGLEFISHLDPHPGRRFGGARPQYVVPDVNVEEIEGELLIRINEHFLPALRVSRDSLDLLKSEPKDSTVREYIMGKLGSAVWLMESVIQRRNTLYRITEQIVDIQREFFEHGTSHLKPLMMQEVAERIGMHVSTVSRALAGKYMQTPQGLYPMKYFFTGGFSTSDGESESNRAIMLKIEDMVKGEDKKNPLSDQEIVALLKKEGIKIARRTVAKYREKLNIPSSRQRKEY